MKKPEESWIECGGEVMASALLGLAAFLVWIGTFMIHPLLGVIVTLVAAAVWVDAVRG